MKIAVLNIYLFIHPMMGFFTLKLLFWDDTKKEAIVSFIILILWFSIWYFFFPFPNLYEHELNLPKMSIFMDVRLKRLGFLGEAEAVLIVNSICARRITNDTWIAPYIYYVFYKLRARKFFLCWSLWTITILFLKLNIFYLQTGIFYTAPYIITFVILLLNVYNVYEHFYNKPAEVAQYAKEVTDLDYYSQKLSLTFSYLCLWYNFKHLMKEEEDAVQKSKDAACKPTSIDSNSSPPAS